MSIQNVSKNQASTNIVAGSKIRSAENFRRGKVCSTPPKENSQKVWYLHVSVKQNTDVQSTKSIFLTILGAISSALSI